MSSIKLYTFPLSGHAHRVELFLSLLGLKAELITINLAEGEQRSPAFLAKNPAGQVPVIEDGAITLNDSNAILLYLANKYDSTHQWYPQDPLQQAQIQSFLSLAAGKLAHGPAIARIVNVFGRALDKDTAITLSHSLLSHIEQHLETRPWLVGEHATIADIAHYTYIAHAPEGDVSLDTYPQIQAWLKSIEQLEGFIAMQKTAVGLSK